MCLKTDVDECEEATHNCHGEASCTNIIGGFECTCNIGYQGDGQTCTGKCSRVNRTFFYPLHYCI